MDREWYEEQIDLLTDQIESLENANQHLKERIKELEWSLQLLENCFLEGK